MIEAKIFKDYGSFRLDVEFSAGNEVLALLGGSGSGKSMTLRCIAGVETPDRGRIIVDGQVFFDSEKHINLTPQQRRVGMLFQNYALFPTMTVLENIMTGVRTGTKREKQQAAEAALIRYQLEGLGDRYPAELSGGQQQRAALARILVGNPRILMLDEPFSALDSHLRDRMEREVMSLLKDYSGTTILVSHSRDEVYRMADSVAVYDRGQINAQGEKHQVFRNPGTYTAALLTGCKNFSRISGLTAENGVTRFHAEDWNLDLTIPGTHTGQVAAIRGHHIVSASPGDPNAFEMEITGAIEDIFEHVLLLRKPGASGAPIHWMIPKGSPEPLPRETVTVSFPAESLMLLQP